MNNEARKRKARKTFLVCSQKLEQAKQKGRMPKWTVLIKAGLYYKPTQDMRNKVKENLLQRAQTYNMLRKHLARGDSNSNGAKVEKNGKTKKSEENRFPGYVLVEMVMTDEAWFVVRNTPNVTGFVGSRNCSKPTPLLEEEIRNILLSMGSNRSKFDLDIKVGDTVLSRRCLHRLYW